MARLVSLLLFVFILVQPVLAEGPWEGSWQVSWPKGAGTLDLTQRGSAVSGAYRSGYGRMEAVAQGNGLTGKIVQDGVEEDFIATLRADGSGFTGRTENGSWLSGVRIQPDGQAEADANVDLSSPRSAIRSFMDASNLARSGDRKALAWAVETINFDQRPDLSSVETRFAAAEDLFDVVDLATFNTASIPEDTPASAVKVTLPQLDATAEVTLELQKDKDGNWHIVMPSLEALHAMGGGAARPVDSFRQLQSPRDTLRAFLDGMSRWRDGGETQAIGTIDLSSIPEVLRPLEGKLIAQYIIRVLDRVGYMPLQSIPNSGASRKPFVLFESPSGRIVIEPIGIGKDTRWKFSSATAQNIRHLYRSIDELPDNHLVDSGLIPASPMFWLRDRVKVYLPVLMSDHFGRGRLEDWQIIFSILGIVVLLAMGRILARIILWFLERPSVLPHVTQPNRLSQAIGLGVALTLCAVLVPMIGLPPVTRQYTLPVGGTVVIGLFTYSGWKIIVLLTSALKRYAEMTETVLDNILLTFGAALARLALLGGAGLSLGYLWSLPTAGLLAGLGIGGLALAFASKETLSNVFGAGILLGDRPFHTGDRISAAGVDGWVEAVGLRSTRVRTLADTMVIVPNGKLADMVIDNLGAAARQSLATTLVVSGVSRPEKLEGFMEAIRNRITADPAFVHTSAEVNISGITETAVQVSVSADLTSGDGLEGRHATNQFFLDILRLAEEQRLSLAGGAAET